jgi:hypothetical protein
MGTWGTAISSNDTYADIYEQFIDLYNEGLAIPEITKRLISENQETINISEDANNFWFAIAKGQWECKALDEEILLKVNHIIKSGEDLRVWKDLGASLQDIKTRERVLNNFLIKLQTEKEKPRRKTKKKLCNSIFKKGDCLTYKMNNGNYGGAFVLTEEQETELGINFIAITTIDKANKPTITDFKKAQVYVKRANETSFKGTEIHNAWVDQPQITGFFALDFKNANFEIEVVGNLPIINKYTVRRDLQIFSNWNDLKSAIPLRDEYAKINGIAKTKLKLTKWTSWNLIKHWL